MKPIHIAAALAAALPALAGETQYWQQASLADFAKGTVSKLSVASDGRLRLAPALTELLDAGTPYLWALARDAQGNLYAGGGTSGKGSSKLFRIDARGQSRTLAELDGLLIPAIAIDARDRVYAATSPDGKVYRVDSSGKAELFYDPKAKYIWALAFSRTGELFVATGEPGQIHRVGADGRGSLFYDSGETHVRSLALDGAGNLIAGTDPNGLVIRVSPAGEGFVLYQTAKREVTAVAVGRGGSIYAAATGNRQAAPLPLPPTAPVPVPSPAPGGGQRPGAPAPVPSPAPQLILPPTVAGGSEVYRIAPDGDALRVFADGSEIVYALGFDSAGKPLLGTGNDGRIYRLDSDFEFTRLRSLAPTQITAFAASGDTLYAATGNIGKVFRLGPELESEGSIESDVLDAGAFATWGRLAWKGEGNVRFETRTGNLTPPQKNWSPWAPVTLAEASGRIGSPAARFAQFRAVLTRDTKAPEVRVVEIAYLPKNTGPRVEEIDIPQANYKFPAPSGSSLSSSNSLSLPPLGRRNQPRPAASSAPAAPTVTSPSMTAAKGWQGVRWLGVDPNGDALTAKIEMRGVAESTWKLLKDGVKEHYYSFDTTTLPDGEYVFRVTVNDAADNPPDQALSASRESEIFWIDNTPPAISGLAGSANGNRLEVSWKARDARSVIVKAEYSVNGGEWLVVEPAGRVSDWKELDYRLSLARPAGEVTIAVRVTDEYDNQSVDKVVVR